MNKNIYNNLILTNNVFLNYLKTYGLEFSSFSQKEQQMWEIYFAIFEADSFSDTLFISSRNNFYCPAFYGSYDGKTLRFDKKQNTLISYALSVTQGKPNVSLSSLLSSESIITFSEKILSCIKNGDTFFNNYLQWRANPDEINATKILNYVRDTPLAIPMMLVSVSNFQSATILYDVLMKENDQIKFLNHLDAEKLLNEKRKIIEKDDIFKRSASISQMASICKNYQEFYLLEKKLKTFHNLQKLPQNNKTVKQKKI